MEVRRLSTLRTPRRPESQQSVLTSRSGTWKQHLRGVDVAVRDRRLRVPGLVLHVRHRVPRGHLVRQRRMAEVQGS